MMTEILLFHHAHGLTSGVRNFADLLREAGHRVHTPDLYDGRTFDDLEGGIGYARAVGFDALLTIAAEAAGELPNDVVYAGFSLGGAPAQMLAQTRPGARGALLFHAALPVAEFSASWPAGVPVQIHAMDADPEFVDSGDIDEARALLEQAEDAELFLYPGNAHLFADNGLSDYDEEAASLLLDRVLQFLSRVG